MEEEMVALRVGLTKAVDDSLNQIRESFERLSGTKELEGLKTKVASNSEELARLHTKIDEVLANQQNKLNFDSNGLEKFLKDGKTTFSKLEDITSIHTAANDMMKEVKTNTEAVTGCIKDNQKIFEKLEEVTNVTNVMKDDLKKVTENQLLKSVAENAEKALPALSLIDGKISSLVESLDSVTRTTTQEASSISEPSVRPKEKRQDDRKTQETPAASAKSSEKVASANAFTGRRGIFFTSSIGLSCNLIDLQERLYSDIKSVRTYHIKENPDSRNPELNLEENVKGLETETDVDYVIISTGTNDISKLDVNDDKGVLMTDACDQAKTLVLLASRIAKNHDVDVFVVEKPPRNDDPTGMRSELTTASNGMLPSLIMPLDKVHLISLPSLHNISEGKKKSMFTDGIHLTPAFVKVFLNDVVRGVGKVFTDIKPQNFQKNDQRNEERNNWNGAARKPFQQDGSANEYQDHNAKNRNWNGRNDQPVGSKVSNERFFQQDGRSRTDGRPYQERVNNDNQMRGRGQPSHSGRGRGQGNQQLESNGRMSQNGFQRDGGRRHGSGSPPHHDQQQRHHENQREWNNSGRSQQQNQQQRGNQGERSQPDLQAGKMPDLLKEYLLKTLMEEDNRRY